MKHIVCKQAQTSSVSAPMQQPRSTPSVNNTHPHHACTARRYILLEHGFSKVCSTFAWLRGRGFAVACCVGIMKNPVARSLFCGCCVGTMKSLVAGSLFCGCVGLANVCRIRSRESAECAKYGCNFCTRVAKSNGFNHHCFVGTVSAAGVRISKC